PKQILELRASLRILAALELRARELHARTNEIRLGSDDALEREGRIARAPAVERGDAEQVVEQRRASEIQLIGTEKLVRLVRLVFGEQALGLLQHGDGRGIGFGNLRKPHGDFSRRAG